jgi:L-2-hydroxyglutarate oxidase LhgO
MNLNVMKWFDPIILFFMGMSSILNSLVTYCYEAFAWRGFRAAAKKYRRNAFEEHYRPFIKQAFVNALQRLISEVQINYLELGGAGVRAQACDYQGNL